MVLHTKIDELSLWKTTIHQLKNKNIIISIHDNYFIKKTWHHHNYYSVKHIEACLYSLNDIDITL